MIVVLFYMSQVLGNTYRKHRTIPIQNVSIKMIDLRNETTHDIFENTQKVNGKLFINLKQRSWDFSFNRSIKNEDHINSLKEVFRPYLGSLNYTKNLFMQFQQPKLESSFEQSMLKDNCWRLDVFPNEHSHIKINLRFCTKSEEKSLIVRQYTYILDVRELGEKNGE